MKKQRSRQNEAELRNAVVSAVKSLYDRGLNSTLSGNVSARLDGNKMLLTPTGSTGILKGDLKPDQLSVVTFDGKLVGGPKQSSEWRVHAKIYKALPRVNAIVHPHPIESLLAVRRQGTHIIHNSFVEFGEARYYLGVEKAPYIGVVRGKSGSEELAAAVLEQILKKKVSVVVMEWHGTVAIGANMAEALGRAEQLEYFATFANRLSGKADARKGE